LGVFELGSFGNPIEKKREKADHRIGNEMFGGGREYNGGQETLSGAQKGTRKRGGSVGSEILA